jgi:hypothetical protein
MGKKISVSFASQKLMMQPIEMISRIFVGAFFLEVSTDSKPHLLTGVKKSTEPAKLHKILKGDCG